MNLNQTNTVSEVLLLEEDTLSEGSVRIEPHERTISFN